MLFILEYTNKCRGSNVSPQIGFLTSSDVLMKFRTRSVVSLRSWACPRTFSVSNVFGKRTNLTNLCCWKKNMSFVTVAKLCANPLDSCDLGVCPFLSFLCAFRMFIFSCDESSAEQTVAPVRSGLSHKRRSCYRGETTAVPTPSRLWDICHSYRLVISTS